MKTFLIAFAAAFMSAASYASIQELHEVIKKDKKRCANKWISPDSCSSTQRDALKRKCITQEEYNYLVKENIVPVCAPLPLGLLAVCPCGCFTSGTRLAVIDKGDSQTKWLPIEQVVDDMPAYSIFAAHEDTTMQSFGFREYDIKSSTKGPETKPIVFVVTKAGLKIGLTEEHAVLMNSGEMVPAKALSVGQSLVDVGGTAQEIVEIHRKPFDGYVYNVLTSGDTNLSHLIGAEGLVVGDSAWQNSLASELYAVQIRQ